MQVVATAPPGTTSACAENTPRHAMLLRIPWNYLRVRGEYLVGKPPPVILSELPPRARRIQGLFCKLLFYIGTTSACAENTN